MMFREMYYQLLFLILVHNLRNYEPSPEESQLFDEFERHVHNQTILEDNALLYITGYVAHRFRNRYPDLGVPTKSLPHLFNDWICTLSKGNCMYPSTNFLNAAIITEEEFLKLHGHFFSKEDKIFDKLTNIVSMKTNNQFPKEVIACLVRTRTYIRLRTMNKDIKQNNVQKKKSRKLYKISNKENMYTKHV